MWSSGLRPKPIRWILLLAWPSLMSTRLMSMIAIGVRFQEAQSREQSIMDSELLSLSLTNFFSSIQSTCPLICLVYSHCSHSLLATTKITSTQEFLLCFWVQIQKVKFYQRLYQWSLKNTEVRNTKLSTLPCTTIRKSLISLFSQMISQRDRKSVV